MAIALPLTLVFFIGSSKADRRNLKKRGIRLGRDVNPANFPGDQKVLDEVLDATWSEHLMFWDAQVGLEAKHGGITKRNIDTSAKFLHGKNTGKTFNNLASGIFFALKYRLTMMTRLINGVIGLAPKNLGKSEFNQSRSLLASVVGTIVAAQTYNYIANGHTDLVDAKNSGVVSAVVYFFMRSKRGVRPRLLSLLRFVHWWLRVGGGC